MNLILLISLLWLFISLLCYDALRYIALCHVMLCCIMLLHVVTCYVILRHGILLTIRAVRRPRRAADNLWAPPQQTFVDRRAAAKNLSAHRRYNFSCVFILLQFSIFDD